MDVTVTNNDEQQLMQMSVLTSKEDRNENPNGIMYETLNLKSKSIERTRFLSRLCSWPVYIFTSLHVPHFSDRSLRITFLLCVTFIGFTSFTIALIVGTSIVQFKQQCPLYASFKFDLMNRIENNWTIKIWQSSERFSPQSTCDFCTFYNVFTFIYCIMTGFFFILFNGDHRVVTSNDRCLIIPWYPVSIILGFFALINASILTNGFLKFCSTITSNDNRIYSCAQLNDLYFEQYPSVSHYFVYMLTAIIASWVQLVFFIGVIAILTIRLGSSFNWTHNRNKQNK